MSQSKPKANSHGYTMSYVGLVADMTVERAGVRKSFRVRLRHGNSLRRLSAWILGDALFPSSPHINDTLFNLKPNEIERHFHLNPAQLSWNLVTFDERFSDRHLLLLRWIREIEIVQVYSNKITDRGIRHLSHLSNLRELFIYSKEVTNSALLTIQGHTKLEVLDMQGASKVNPELFHDAISKMHLRRSWPPHQNHGMKNEA